MLKRSWIRNLQQTLKLQSRYRVRRRRSRQTIEALECRALLSGGPVLNSINLVGATPTNASIVSFTATFSEPVTGVDPTDFSLVETGTIGATLTQVTPVSQSVYTVTVSGITGSGTLGLNLINNGSIQDLIGNGLTSQNASFADQTTLDTENGPRSVTTGDVNGDGKLDLAVTNEWSNSVGVFLGNGDGTFGTQLTFATGDIPMALALGDVDGDGKPDLVVTNYGSDTVSVLLGNGDGTFGTQQTYATWSSPMSVAIGDVNGDGKPDLAVANSGGTFENPNDVGGNTVSVLLGNGNGTFQTQQTFATGLKPHVLALGDVNADGKLDLAVTNWGSNTVSVFLGNGNGTFGTPQTYDTESDPHEVLLGDLNADGKLDLAVANSHGNSVSVFLGNGNGTFGTQQTFATTLGPNSLVMGDLNGDFKPDLVTANWESSTVNVLLGNGNGTFGTQQTFATGSNPFSVALGDVNSDGKPDLAVANWNSNTLGVLLNTVNFTSQVYMIDRISPLVQSINRTTPSSANTNASSVTYTVTFSEPVTGVDPTDFSLVKTGTIGTTLMQVVPVSSTVYTVTVSGITGNGTLGLNLVDNDSIKNSSDLPLGDPGLNNGNFSGSITTLDHASPWVQSIDRAIPADANTNASTVTFTATFSEPVTGVDPTDFSLVQTGSVGVTLTQISVVSPSVYRLTASGVTGNGTLGLNLVDNGSIHDLAGNQLTTQNAIASFANQTTFATGSGPWSVATGDMNGDGNPDLVVVNQLSNTVSLRLGDGDGTFQSQQTIATGSGPFSVAFGDVNGDGHSDLAVANSRGSTVSVFLGNGNGAFAAQRTFSTGTSPFSVTMGDVNGDGSPDLITANAFNSTVSVLLGNGNGTFQAKRIFSTGSIPFSVTIGDLNSDGKPDLISANGNDNTVSVLMGNGDGTFELQQSVAVGAFPKSVTIGDLNGDGKPDIATANWDDNSVSVLLGNGDGSFQSQQTFATGTNPYSVTLGDVNGDGKPDLAVVNFGSNTVSVLLGDGIGAFRPQQTFAAGNSPVSVTLGDVNHDGKPDLAVTNSGDDTLSLFLATSNGNFTGQVYSIDHISPFVVSINRTSPTSDYAPTAPSSVTFTVTFSEPVTGVEFFNFRPATTRTILADVDPWDVTTLNDREYTVTVSHITGIGTLGLSLVDGDTIRDLHGNRLITPGNGVKFEYGMFGRYAFGHPPEYGTPLELEPVGDVNRDGYPDKIIPFYGRRDEGNNVDEGADLQLGNSDGTFGDGVAIYVRGRGARTSVALGDVNRDGKLDVVVGIWDGYFSDGSVLLGNGDGTFRRMEDYPSPWDFFIEEKPESGYFLRPRPSLTLEDVNGDSNLDLVVVTSNALSVLLGNGNGTFQPQQWIDLSPLQSDSVQLGDFNEDGRPDFIIASDVDQKWGALLNTTNGDFTGQVYTFETAPVVTDDPDDQEGYYYDNFSFEASASEAPDAQWQLSTDNGASWVNIIADNVDSWIETTTDYRSGVTTTILTIGPYLANMNVGSLYRVVFSNEVNTATTGPASFKIYTPPVVTWQPSPTTVRAGEIAEFTANADGFPTPTVKWQVSNDSGVNWNDIAGETSTTYRFMTKSTDNGNQYRAMFSNLAESDVPTYAATLSVPPVVTSINLVGPPTMNATSLIFTATFSEPVTGVDSTDFSLVTTGTVGTTLVQVTPVSTLVYNVTVSGITGNGTLGINLIDNDSIKDLFLIPLSGAGAENGNFTGPIVTLDHISPFVQSINRTIPASATTNASSVSFTATFSEPVTGVDPTDFTLVMTGTIGATLTQVTPVSASVYSVTVSGITGNGTLGLNLVDNGSIHDFVGNSLTSLNVPSFAAQASIPTGSSPRSLVLGDVDADGKSDLVVANSGDNSVSLLLGNGNGTFQAQQTFAAGTAPVSIVVGDLNNDGNPDLAVANLGSNTVSVLLGHGNGAFEAQQTFATESMPYSLAMGDLNADGKLDLAVVNRGSDSVSVLLGNGNGTFQTQIRFPTESAPSSIELGDLNGDGKLDLVIANHDSDTVSVLLGNGDATFQSQQTFATGSEPYSVVIGDLNGDGDPDLAIANRNSSTVSVLLGNGDGTFQSQQTFASAPGAISMAIGDLNGDGKLDLAIENGTFFILRHPNDTITLWALLGKGDGTFTPPQVLRTGILGYAVTLGDVNNDGKSDLVAANSNVETASVLLNTISGDFTGQTYTLDHTSPRVKSINRSIPASTTTNATTLTFTATFSEPVTGVDPTDFSLAKTGTIGTTLTQVTQVNASVYTVTISGITGEGTLGLNLIDDGSISDLAGNRLTSGTDASFAHQATFRTETDQFSVTMGDFNGDNKLDLAVAGGGGVLDSVSVLLGSGNGTFQTYQSFPTGSLPSWVTTGDVNGDGKLDLVVANQDSANVSILLGNGNGTFQPQQTFATGTGPISVVLGDVNGDGTPDLVVANVRSNTLSVLLGNGNGTFQPEQTFATGSWPNSVIMGDVNGDGKPDLAVANSGSSLVSVLLGNGNGTFELRRDFPTPNRATGVAMGDVNGDGRADLIVTLAISSVGVSLGNGDGSFQSLQVFETGTAVYSPILGDVNGDGKPDIVVANESDDTVSVLLGNEDGTFQSQQTFATGDAPISVTMGDVNGDGKPDLAVASFGSRYVSVLLGNTNGNFTGQVYTLDHTSPWVQSINRTNPVSATTNASSVTFTATFSEPVTGVDPTDFSLVKTGTIGATLTQIAVVSPSVYTVTIGGITGNGTLGLNLIVNGTIQDLAGNGLSSQNVASFTNQVNFAAGVGPHTVTLGDLNRDGNSDLVVTNIGSNTVSVMLGNGNGTFETQQTFATGSGPFSVSIGDVNGDGNPDLAVENQASNSVSVLLGNGNGTFQTQQTFATQGSPTTLALGDVNKDSKLDLVVANQGGGTVSILLGNGNGTFKPQQTFSAGGGLPNTIALGDMNGDGNPDLAVSNWAGFVSLLMGNGDGTFQPQQKLLGAGNLDSVTMGDVNGDGNLDIAVANRTGNSILVFLGNGNGTFKPQQSFATGSFPRSVVLGDVNRDGMHDLVVSNESSNTVSVLLGNGNGTFQTQQTFTTGSRPFSVTLGDMNGDGRTDLAVANWTSNSVSVLLNTTNNFIGQVYTLDHTSPSVQSINRTTPATMTTSAISVVFTATLNEPVTGVDLTDFLLVKTGTVGVTLLQVSQISPSIYTVTVGGITGDGSLGLNLVDDGSIRDLVGNVLTVQGAGGKFTGQAYTILHIAPSVTTQPVNTSVDAGATAMFSAAASGSPTPTIQWQVSLNGGSGWTNISGATSASLSVVTVAGDNGKKYRAVFSNVAGTAITNVATLTVSSTPAANVSSIGVRWGTSGSATLVNASGGRLLPAGRTNDFAWFNINRLTITLDRPLSTLDPASISVVGIVGGSYGPVTVSGSGTTWTITLAKAITNADKVTVVIGNSHLVTYQRRLDVLPGDFNDDGVVATGEVTLVNNATIRPYNIWADLNGDGVVDINDVRLARRKVGTRLPT